MIGWISNWDRILKKVARLRRDVISPKFSAFSAIGILYFQTFSPAFGGILFFQRIASHLRWDLTILKIFSRLRREIIFSKIVSNTASGSLCMGYSYCYLPGSDRSGLDFPWKFPGVREVISTVTNSPKIFPGCEK